LTVPVMGELARRAGITVYTQNDPFLPDTAPGPVHDLALDVSHRLGSRSCRSRSVAV
jgi:hypothetical protein